MIQEIYIKNFKSINEITLLFGQFNCLLGMNGAGKSTILQAIDFLAHLMTGQVREWLDLRGWSAADLNSKLSGQINLNFSVVFITASNQRLLWAAAFNRSGLRCYRERIDLDGKRVFSLNGYVCTSKGKDSDVNFVFYGSLLSQLKDTQLLPEILEFREAMRNLCSLELLSPQLMRKRARGDEQGDIGAGGEKLSAFLHTLKGESRARLLELLKTFYPALVDFKVTSQRGGWKKLSVIEQFGEKRLVTEATHLSDGLLRILAVLAQTDSDRALILLDEIENGINQEIMQKLVEALLAAPQQILVTTHSPLILNYLEDEVADKWVQFVYKTPEGGTRVRPFFAIPRIAEKLRSMGPGDAFVDTDLHELTRECCELDRQVSLEQGL